MFDTINGLPVHILIIHVVVVIGPLTALAAMAYAVRPAWRERLAWPLVVGGVTTGITGAIAGSSGESLEARVRQLDAGDAAAIALVHDHAEAGDLAKVVAILLMLVVLAAVFALLPPGKPGRFGAVIGKLTAAALIVVSLGAIASITYTGHTGAKAAWAADIATTQAGHGD